MAKRLPVRLVGILMKDNKILLLHRIKNDNEYYVFPGGGLEQGETKREGLKREMREETNLEIEIDRLLYIHDYSSNQQLFYLCKYINGRAKLTEDSDEMRKMEKGDQLYEPVWMDIKEFANLLVYPLEVRDWLIKDLKEGFPKRPRKAKLKFKDLRQSL
jgi:ADP-ribose pyrophosphatase YjhB (NUDIX family)